MRNTVVVLTLLAGASSLAWAQTTNWSAYETAFPAYPCQDGWMGCIQDGKRIDPELQRDGMGMPVPADMRIGWFDLKPTANFSPFVGLSKYTGEAPKTQTAAAPVPSTPEPGATGTTNAGTGGDGVATGEPPQPKFFDADAERARAEAEDARKMQLETERAERAAKEEAERAKAEEAARKRTAEVQTLNAQKALEAANNAQNAAEKARLQQQAKEAQEASLRAAAQLKEAENLRKKRDAEAAAEQKRAADAAAASKRADQEKAAREADEKRKADAAAAAEAAARAKADADAKAAADVARKKAEAEAAVAKAAADKAAADAQAAIAAANNAEAKAKAEADAKKAADERAKAEAAAKAKVEAAAAEAARLAKEKADAEAKARADAEQKRQDEERKRLEDERKAKELAATQAAGVEPTPTTASADAGGCSDLVQLETVAILGKLTAEQTQCLEASLTAAERMTQKSKISRVLMVHAFSAGETDRWEQLMKRHLEEIEQSDPDLCYKYSLHLSKKTTTGAAYGVIRWSNVALENRTVWTGSTYTQRVFSLYKIRAVAAQRIWQDLENTHASNPTEESNQKVKDARNQTKVFAREWYEYAKVAGKDVTLALNLCMSAAGTKDYCEAG